MLLSVFPALVFLVLSLTSFPAHAVYKCGASGHITYSDTPCPGGQSLPAEAPADANNARAAADRAARDKAQVSRMQNERQRRNVAEESARQHLEAGRLAHQKKCKLLEMKKKWGEEDAAAATLKATAKAKRKAHRHAEQYELECG